MEVRLASGFLPLLVLAWLPTGLTHQVSATINASVELDLILQCLLQTGSSSTAGEVKWCNTTRNNGEKQNEGGVEMRKGTVSQPEESVIAMECRFEIWSENLMVHVKWYKPAGLEERNQTNTMALGENCTNLTSPGVRAANMGICGCRLFITGTNLTDTGNSMQGTVPSNDSTHPCTVGWRLTGASVMVVCAGLNFLLCIIFGLAIGTLLYMPIIGLLLWQCRRNRKGKLTSRQVVEGNQLSMAAPVIGTEDLTYANLTFEKNGTKPASSDIIYTKIKPSQQKQSSGDASAANAGVDVSPEGEGK
ncbi:hypothetical protein QYF61_001961 [Mycteria americana]|uniref:Ig-like domain-containing protein n=1 Tax=Mycteria americana TaxID=33587 RepID=A0AAN7NMW0_MYCAM|nr:hypothetical protein QYF61_001961 [Mycteria americana]